MRTGAVHGPWKPAREQPRGAPPEVVARPGPSGAAHPTAAHPTATHRPVCAPLPRNARPLTQGQRRSADAGESPNAGAKPFAPYHRDEEITPMAQEQEIS
ncbi:hypothetical protein [Streptomyces sp. NBC_00690]|uniref:hypothetical protein n=1 Tax=Streptomyces sp. NBC_00690 TaxID=2975808 RepID=UPI002E291E18|nr:hypothetical protein [Streptomyces sp. NBC_00690]